MSILDKEILLYKTPEYSPMRADFFITLVCPHERCGMCGLPKSVEKFEPMYVSEEFGIYVIEKLSSVNPPIKTIVFTGGEPTIHKNLPLFIREVTNRKLEGYMNTDCSWGRILKRAKKYAETLVDAGLRHCALSVDTFHQERVPLKNVINAGKVLIEAGIETILLGSASTLSTKKKDDELLDKVGDKLFGYACQVEEGVEIILDSGYAARVDGSWAANLPQDEFSQIPGASPTCTEYEDQRIIILPDGTIKYCGSYVSIDNPSYTLGSIKHMTFKEALKIGNEESRFKLLRQPLSTLKKVLSDYKLHIKNKRACLIHSEILSDKEIADRADEILEKCQQIEITCKK
ncbi:MAG: radical SAM protein [Candidatus Thorarchaeota archaeon]|jgi:hypothetical protein